MFDSTATDVPSGELPGSLATRAWIRLSFFPEEDPSFVVETCVGGVIGRDAGCLVSLNDARVSRAHLRIEPSGEDCFSFLDLTSRNGTRCNGRASLAGVLEEGDVLKVGGTVLVVEYPCADELGLAPGSSVAYERARRALTAAARAGRTLLLDGPRGSGKECMAREVHRQAGLAGSFAVVDLDSDAADIGSSLRSSDVAPGTLYIPELHRVRADQFGVLLRWLERQRRTRRARHPAHDEHAHLVIAGTEVAPKELVERGTFAAAQLLPFLPHEVHLAQLSGRRAEIPRLFAEFARWPDHRRASPHLWEDLLLHPWPNQIPELRAVAESLSESAETRVELRHLPPGLRALFQAPDATRAARRPMSREAFRALYARHDGNRTALARELSTSRAQVLRLIRRHGLETEGHDSGAR